MNLKQRIVCVDISEQMLKIVKDNVGVNMINCDCIEYAKNKMESSSFDRILLKEVIHHIKEDDIESLYYNLYNGLCKGGICLTVTRPKYDINYPFFEKAKVVWSRNQYDMGIICDVLKKVGFKNVRVTINNFPITIKKEVWIDMILDRFWSTFSSDNFDDDELKEGVEEIINKFSDEENISFEERMIFIEGVKIL